MGEEPRVPLGEEPAPALLTAEPGPAVRREGLLVEGVAEHPCEVEREQLEQSPLVATQREPAGQVRHARRVAGGRQDVPADEGVEPVLLADAGRHHRQVERPEAQPPADVTDADPLGERVELDRRSEADRQALAQAGVGGRH